MNVHGLLADLFLFMCVMGLLAAAAQARIALTRRGEKSPPVLNVPPWLGWLLILGVAGFMTFVLWGLVRLSEAGYFNIYVLYTEFASIVIGTALVMKFVPKTNPNVFLAVMVGAFVTFPWAFYPSWLTIDLAMLVWAVASLIVPKARSVRLLVYAEVGIVAYDVYNVFASGLMLDMARLVLPHRIPTVPILMVVPDGLSLDATYIRALGLGDIVLPGFMIMVAATLVGNGIGRRLHLGGLIGYAVGLALTFVVLEVWHAAQPATLYLVPCTMLGIWWAARREGVWSKVWGKTVKLSVREALRHYRKERAAQS